MSELLTVAFVWGGLVFLGRGAAVRGGADARDLAGWRAPRRCCSPMAALAWWSAWTHGAARVIVAALATRSRGGRDRWRRPACFGSPNHHVAYLLNDLGVCGEPRRVSRCVPALWDGRILCALALVPALPLLTGVAAAWSRLAIGRTVVRVTLALLLVLATFLYLRLGGRAESLRHVGWLAGSLSLPGLVLALVGTRDHCGHGAGRRRVSPSCSVVLVAAIFVPSPRVAGYQPWAMRRYLPVVLPGLALGVGASLGLLMDSPRRTLRVVATRRPDRRPGAAGATDDGAAGHGLLQRTASASLRTLADRLPTDALVVLDGGFADLQIQVPLWLVFGRETVVVSSGGPPGARCCRSWSAPAVPSTGSRTATARRPLRADLRSRPWRPMTRSRSTCPIRRRMRRPRS